MSFKYFWISRRIWIFTRTILLKLHRIRAKPLVGYVSATEPTDIYSEWSIGLHMRHLFGVELHLTQEGCLRSSSYRVWEWQPPISRAVGNQLPDFPMWNKVLMTTDQLTRKEPLRRSYSMSGQDNHDKSTKGSSYRHTLIMTYPAYITKFKCHDYQWNWAKVFNQRHLYYCFNQANYAHHIRFPTKMFRIPAPLLRNVRRETAKAVQHE